MKEPMKSKAEQLNHGSAVFCVCVKKEQPTDATAQPWQST